MAETTPNKPKRPYRPPIGIPVQKQGRAGSAIVSVIVHAIILLLILGPIAVHEAMEIANEGAGGKSAPGGGGGGRRGPPTAERATFIQVTPPPPPKQPTPTPVPPPVVKPPEPVPEPPKPEAVPMPVATAPAVSAGTGSDGTNGNGPGTGGGVGSGNGPGRGTGNGPGTGGGEARVYPPTVTHLALLPLPVPSKVRPYKLVAIFEVDEKGIGRLLQFNETRDGDYNKKIRAMLAEIRFRPAVRADGTPVKDTTSVTAEAR